MLRGSCELLRCYVEFFRTERRGGDVRELTLPGREPEAMPVLERVQADEGGGPLHDKGVESSVGAARINFTGDTVRGFSRNLATGRARLSGLSGAVKERFLTREQDGCVTGYTGVKCLYGMRRPEESGGEAQDP